MQVTAEESDRFHKLKSSHKTAPDTGFSDYAQMSLRKYERLVKDIKPDHKAYEKCVKERERVRVRVPFVFAHNRIACLQVHGTVGR